MKEIICSETTTLALQNLQTILEVIFGRTAILCASISREGTDLTKTLRNINASVRVFCPERDIKVTAEFKMVLHNDSIILDPKLIQHVAVETGPDERTHYVVWYVPGLNVVKISQHGGGQAVWLVGNSADNRWTEPFYENQTDGLSYDI